MKKIIVPLNIVGVYFIVSFLFSAYRPPDISQNILRKSTLELSANDWKKEAFAILDNKCNSCHRKKNPFKIFSLRNMDKHGPKIYEQVFVKRRMPKGDEVRLTEQEYETLKNWLTSQKIISSWSFQ